jgi:serine/threonine protein kinase
MNNTDRPTVQTEGSPDEGQGQSLGRYKLLERIGEGGCGVVYVAEQSEPVRRRVALKVIKLGMDTKAVVARFEAERQALAMMDHPNIAKVLDAGATETGRPYFVMELVRGIRITDYCDQNNLTTKERLELFIPICQAIQHAHQKGIIHRDIKPSNILVTLHDGVPVPKVIDFGIAKATEGRLTDATVYTQLHQFIGTPAYMSPEQAEMSGLDVDTRSDIYSLGVLLYELLTGKTPFDAKELMSQGIDSMRKTIREKDPVRPSTKLATLKGEELTTTAKRRSVETSKLVHQLRGDLDWIVMKCLEKDRRRRYETANGLAADLKRHLNDEAITARPASKLYRIQKTVRRNKLVCTASALVLLALVAGTVVSLWQAIRAKRAQALALQTRGESEELSNFILEDLYTELEPTGRFELIAGLARKAVEYYNRLPSSLRTPETEQNNAMAQARLALITARQGDSKGALLLATSAVNTFEQRVKAGDHSEPTLYGFGLALFAQHWCYNVREDLGRLVPILQRGAEVLKPLANSPQGSHRVKLLYADFLNFSCHYQATHEQAVAMCEEALRVLAEVGALDLLDLTAATAWADTADSEARHLVGLGHLEDAERLENQVKSLAERVLTRSPGSLRARYTVAEALQLLKDIATRRFRYAEAAELARQSQAAAEDYVRVNPSDEHGWGLLGIADREAALASLYLGRTAEAVQTTRAIFDRKLESSGTNTVLELSFLGRAFLAFASAQQGDRAAAEQALREARRDLDAYKSRVSLTDLIRTSFEQQLEDYARQIKMAFGEDAGVFESARSAVGPMETIRQRSDLPYGAMPRFWLSHAAMALDEMARAALNLKRFNDSEAAARALIELRLTSDELPFFPLDAHWGRVLLAQAQIGQSRSDEALKTLEPALVHYRSMQVQGAADFPFRQQFARALYVQALAQPADSVGSAHRRDCLNQAAKLLNELPDEARQWHDVKQLLSWIGAEQKNLNPTAAGP